MLSIRRGANAKWLPSRVQFAQQAILELDRRIMKERCKKLLKNSVLVIFNLVSLDSAVVKYRAYRRALT